MAQGPFFFDRLQRRLRCGDGERDPKDEKESLGPSGERGGVFIGGGDGEGERERDV